MEKEVEYLNNFVKKGRKSARELTRAHILLLVDDGKTEMEIKDTSRKDIAKKVSKALWRRNQDPVSPKNI